jgi:macrolide transport system ATP-binding/permease protein
MRTHWLMLKQDLRYALRSLRQAPTFAATVIATLALGIGANSVIFSAVDAILLRDAPVWDPERLVEVYTTSGSNRYSNSSYPDYFDLRDSGTFASLAAYTPVSVTIDVHGQPEPIAGQMVSGNYFDVLGVPIPLGRRFTASDDRIGAPARVAIVSHALWLRAFDGDPARVGQPIRLNGHSYTLAGVAPPGFSGPALGVAADVWIPTALQPEVDPPAAASRRAYGSAAVFDRRRSRGLSLVGRLPGNATIGEVAARAEVVAARLERAYPDTNTGRRFTLAPLGEALGLRVSTRPMLVALTAVVVMVLLVACVNVASLLLARGVSREREVAVRLAIGASRGRLVRQWLTESVLLGVLGATGALLVARIGTPLLHAFVVPSSVDLSLNLRVLAFTLAAGVGSGLLFGLAPVLQTLRKNAMAGLGDRGVAGGTARAARMRGPLVIVQIAVSLVLLVGAGLFLRTLERVYAVNLGYDIDRILLASINLEPRGYFEGGPKGPEPGAALYRELLARVEALPGVVSAAAARVTVLSGSTRSTAVTTDGRPMAPDLSNAFGVRANVVSHRYFETMGIPILHGRDFDASDAPDTPRVIIITKSLADRLWPDGTAIGRTLYDGATPRVVIGIVPDTVSASPLEGERRPTYYSLLAQSYESAVTLHVRAAGNPFSLVPAIRDAVRKVDDQLAIQEPQLLRDVLTRTLGAQRMAATLVGLFGAIALVLAGLGLYGVMAHVAAERTKEIGIRVAMGARPSSIVFLLLRQGARLLAIGTAIGMITARVTTQTIEAQLFGVTATDRLTFAAGCAVLVIAGLMASLIPALRATRIDPVAALRG